VKEFNFARPKTITTRKARSDDDNHIYVSKEEFFRMIREDELLEWDEYSGNFYGIMSDDFRDLLQDEKNNGIVMDLTLEGFHKVKEACKKAVAIALLPDDFSWLSKRLIDRGSNDKTEIEKRVKISRKEAGEILKMQVPIIHCNFDPENTKEVLEKIIRITKEQPDGCI